MNDQVSIKERAARWFCRHRRGWPWRWAGQLSYLLWRAYENRNFDMQTNGEEWYLRGQHSLRPHARSFYSHYLD